MSSIQRALRHAFWRRAAATALSLVILPVMAIVGIPGAAQGNPSENLITGLGFGDSRIEWDGEGEVSRYSYANSGVAGLWQAILWADGAIERDGTRFDESDIDCQFGPNTEAATRNWQRTHGVGVDGKVGPKTFGRADNQLIMGEQVEPGSDQRYYFYVGSNRTLTFVRNGSLDVPPAYRYAYAGRWDGYFFRYRNKPYQCGGDPSIPLPDGQFAPGTR